MRIVRWLLVLCCIVPEAFASEPTGAASIVEVTRQESAASRPEQIGRAHV